MALLLVAVAAVRLPLRHLLLPLVVAVAAVNLLPLLRLLLPLVVGVAAVRLPLHLLHLLLSLGVPAVSWPPRRRQSPPAPLAAAAL